MYKYVLYPFSSPFQIFVMIRSYTLNFFIAEIDDVTN